jgi:hypothetical protein
MSAKSEKRVGNIITLVKWSGVLLIAKWYFKFHTRKLTATTIAFCR